LNRRTEYIISGLLPCDGSDFVASNVVDDFDRERAQSDNANQGEVEPIQDVVDGTQDEISANTAEKAQNKAQKNTIKPEDLVQNDMKVGDADGDGIPDYLDSDSDNDGIPDATEGRGDSDKDGLPNFIDLDSDNDGIPDRIEGALDFDKDGKGNFIDTDSDNDGILDSSEGLGDADNDGNPNYLDLDSDGDGVTDKLEGTRDSDNDGIMNFLDSDSDNDGVSDLSEGTKDTDGDGIPNYRDEDSDNDGIPDRIEVGSDPRKPVDSDKDGKPDYIDSDSDEDGIPDKVEAPSNYSKYPKDLVPNINAAPKSNAVQARKKEVEEAPADRPAPTPVKKETIKNTNQSKPSEPEQKIVPGVVYRVQVKMALKPVEENKFLALGLKDIFMYRSGNYYKYCSGAFQNEADAETYKEALRRKGFSDAFVVKFDNSVRVMK
jgi:hypothetical protein